MSKHWQTILFGAFTHSKSCQLQSSYLYLACVGLNPRRFYAGIHPYELSLCSAVVCGNPSSCGKRQLQVLPEGNGGAEEREEGLPLVSCLEAETEGRDQATLAETSCKSIWRPFYLSALPQLLPAFSSYGSILSAIFTSHGSKNHFCVEAG